MPAPTEINAASIGDVNAILNGHANADGTLKSAPVQAALGGSLPALSGGGPPTSGTYVANQIVVDTNGVAWWCTASGTPGTWKFWGSGFFPGITTNDSSGTDYGAIINTYMATLPPYTDTPRLPPGSIYCGTEVIPPLAITLVGSHWTENPNLLRATVLRPLAPAMARVASLSNSQSGMRNLAVNGEAIGSPNAAAIAFGVYASFCKLDHFTAVGASNITFDANTSATDLDMCFFIISETGGVPTTATLIVAGSDWIVSGGRTNGPVVFGGGGNQWGNVHFVGQSTGTRTPFLDNGGQQFNGCYFDSVPPGASLMIDRSSAAHTSSYDGCFYYQNVTGLGATSAVIKETATAGAGAVITGGFVRGVDNTTWGYFIKGAIASSSVLGVKGEVTFQTGFTDATPPLGHFVGCMNAGALANLGGEIPGSNQKSRLSLQANGIGVIAEPFPASSLISTPLAPATQQEAGILVGLQAGDVVTGIMIRCAVAAAGANPTNVRFGIADSTGKVLAISADHGTAGSNDATTFFAVGPNKIPLASPFTVPASGNYYLYFVVNGTWGTTQPTMGVLSVTAALLAAAAGAAPPNFVWTGQTDSPAVNSSLTITGTSGRSFYLAAY